MCDVVSKWRSILSEIKHYPGVSLLVVSKNASSESIDLLFKEGQLHFGENRVQDLFQKASSLSSNIKWHFIGHIQSNKCSLLLRIPNLYMVESLDSLDLASKLDDLLKNEPGRTLFVLVQVNTSLKETQFGMDYRDLHSLTSLVKTILSSSSLVFRGLMTIGDGLSPCFDRLVDLKSKLCETFPECKALCDSNSFVLSMGMTNDYHLAISKGSTQIRIGSLIFS